MLLLVNANISLMRRINATIYFRQQTLCLLSHASLSLGSGCAELTVMLVEGFPFCLCALSGSRSYIDVTSSATTRFSPSYDLFSLSQD